MVDNTNKAKFNVLKTLSPLKLGNKIYYISKQEIVQESSGNSSTHLVVKKQPMNEDGSPQGVSKQLFIPIDDSVQVLECALEFCLVKK